MSRVGIYQQQLASFDQQITDCSSIMAELDAQGITGNELAECLHEDCKRQESMKATLNKLKAGIQAKIDRLQSGWTGVYATYVTEIVATNDKYERTFEKWLAEDMTDKYVPFFKMYGQAQNDFQKQRLLKMTFGI